MTFKDMNNKIIRKGNSILDFKDLEIYEVNKVSKYDILISTCGECDNEDYFNEFTVVVPKSKIPFIESLLTLARKARKNDSL